MWMASGTAGSSITEAVSIFEPLLYLSGVATRWLLGVWGLHDLGEREILFLPHPDGIYLGTLLLAILGLCTGPKRNHSGLGMKCHIDELEGRQGGGLIDSLQRATWDGSRAVFQGEESGAGLIKAIAVHSWVSLKGLESEFFHSKFDLVPFCLRKSHLE